MQALIDYASYMPHGYCLFWQPWLVTLHVGADLLIFLSYSMIPVALVMFLRRRPDLRYRGLVALFAAFILLCGITHLVSIVTLWVPIYPIQGLLKLLTGMVSALTAATLFVLIPRLVAIPSPRQLEEVNADLRREIAAHEKTLDMLRSAQRGLETQVEERTRELTAANARLSVMTQEAVHRSRNLLAVVNSIVRQTALGARDIQEFMASLTGRISALSTATAAVMDGPSRSSVALDEMARRQLAPLIATFASRIVIEGPTVEVGAQAAQQLSLALHELGTNAMKHGALSSGDGTVKLHWDIAGRGDQETLTLRWQETGTSRKSDPPPQKGSGFGKTLLLHAVPGMLGGSARSEYDTDILYELVIPLARVLPEQEMATMDLPESIWALKPGAA